MFLYKVLHVSSPSVTVKERFRVKQLSTKIDVNMVVCDVIFHLNFKKFDFRYESQTLL